MLNGNPSKVKDPSSPCAPMQAKDDYDHAVFLHVAGPERAFVKTSRLDRAWGLHQARL